MKHSNLIVAAAIFCSLSLTCTAQQTSPRFLQYMNHPWVDSVYRTLTPVEKIAQLIVVAAFSNKDDAHTRDILKLIRQQKIGGLIFFQGGPVREAKLINT